MTRIRAGVRRGWYATLLLGTLIGTSSAVAIAGDAATPAAGEHPGWTPSWLGVPGGLTFDVVGDAGKGDTLLFVRFAEAREDPVTVTIHDVRGAEVARLSGDLERGSVLLVWDGTRSDGAPAGVGTYVAHLVAGEREAGVTFERR